MPLPLDAGCAAQEQGSVHTEQQLLANCMNKDRLKEIYANLNCPVSGSKEVLLQRILEMQGKTNKK